MKCDACGSESEVEQAFYKLRRSFSSKVRNLCPACWTRRHTNAHRRSFFGYIILGLTGLLLVPLNGFSSFGCFLLNLAILNFFSILATIPHEFGHALAAHLVGMRVFRVIIGFGRTLFECRIFGFRFEFKSIPYGGFAIAAPRNLAAFRLRYLVFVLAGPMTNVALAILAWRFREPTEFFLRLDARLQPFNMFFLANVAAAAVSLIPYRVNTVLGQIPNDALAAWETLFSPTRRAQQVLVAYYVFEGMELMERQEFRAAEQWFDTALKQHPNDPILMSCAGVGYLNRNMVRKAREMFLQVLALPEIETGVRYLMMNNVAYTDALLSDPTLLPEADQYSKEAFQHLKWDPSVRGTRGTVLVELGEIEGGIALLKQAMSEHEDRRSKALSACHIAIGEEKRGNQGEAGKYWLTARQLDPKCILLPGIKIDKGRDSGTLDQSVA